MTESRVISTQEVHNGPIFNVDRVTVELKGVNLDAPEETVTIEREVVRHVPVVVMLVHDVATDNYLLEREYRVGPNAFVPGLPAGFMEKDEKPIAAMERELREETGITSSDVVLDYVGSFYSSEGMTDEMAIVGILHLRSFEQDPLDLDEGEYVHSEWVTWDALLDAGIMSSNSVIAIEHEALRRTNDPNNAKISQK